MKMRHVEDKIKLTVNRVSKVLGLGMSGLGAFGGGRGFGAVLEGKEKALGLGPLDIGFINGQFQMYLSSIASP